MAVVDHIMFVPVMLPEMPLHWFYIEEEQILFFPPPCAFAVTLHLSACTDANALTQRKTSPDRGSFGDVIFMQSFLFSSVMSLIATSFCPDVSE